MGLRCGMRTTKCQLLVTSLCVMLLGLSVATLSTVTHYGLHFTLLSNISLESNSYRVIHHTAFYFGICLSMTLILAALLSSAATVRESQLLTAMGFFCFALAFCGLIPAACWRYTHSTEVYQMRALLHPSFPRTGLSSSAASAMGSSEGRSHQNSHAGQRLRPEGDTKCGRQHDGCVRSCVRGGEEERLQLQKARADCHPRSIPVLREALSIWGHSQC
ncbi:tetraspanin-32 isoform X9 [Chroicocephalus ridibundus]|uniref:tetraspanin-32 isoform X9 n=1 Tax=Chroicocephalus ridibundus TaxID=1192867 RepID=UPI002FDEA284